MRFKDYFSLKHILFAVVLMALMIGFAVRQSENMVKVYFEDAEVQVVSSRFSMAIPYDMIDSADLAELAEPGEKISNGYDDDIIRSGLWKNDTWGEYNIVADLDATNCITVRLTDGRIFVFNRKDNAETFRIYETLLTYLPTV